MSVPFAPIDTQIPTDRVDLTTNVVDNLFQTSNLPEIRMQCIEQAVKSCMGSGFKDEDDILETAKKYFDWVMDET